MTNIDETLSLVKELYSHSIIHKDKYYEEKLLQVIINLSTIDNNVSSESSDLKYQDEIDKVKRKVPKWMKKTQQYNYHILKSFMDISDNNSYRVSVDELKEYADIGESFLANYNNLKTISEKNHAKVFDEINREVELWEPVAEFIINKFKNEGLITKSEISEIKIAKFARQQFTNLLEQDLLNEQELLDLQNQEYVQENFNVNYPILKKVTNNANTNEERNVNGRPRYYAKPIKGYLLCKEWYENERDRKKLDYWLTSVKS